MIYRIRCNKDNVIVSISGKMNYADHPVIRKIMNNINKKDSNNYIIDLENLEYIDTAGVAMLFLVIEECEKVGAKISLRTPEGYARRVLEVCKLQEWFDAK